MHSEPPRSEEERDGEDAFNLPNLIQLLRTNIWLLVAATVLGVGFAAWSYYKKTPRYTAGATVVIETQSQNVFDFRSVVSNNASNFYAMNTEVLLLRSHDLMGRIADALALQNDPEFNPALRPPSSGWKELIGYDQIVTVLGLADGSLEEAAPDQGGRVTERIDQVMTVFGLGEKPALPQPTADRARERAISLLFSKLRVSQIEDTYAFRLTATTEGARKSADIANKFAELYVEKKREISFQATNEAMTWLSGRVVELKGELEIAEAAVEELAAGTGLVSEEALVANSRRLMSMRERQAEQKQAAENLKVRISNLAQLRSAEDYGALGDALEDLQLRGLARELALQPGDEAMLNRFDRLLEEMLQTLHTELGQYESQMVTLTKPIAELQETVEAQSADLVQLRQLRREAEAARLVYEHSLRRMKEISVQEGLEQADVRVLSAAVIPGAPSSAKAQSTIVRGGAIGLFLGVALIFLRNMLRVTIRTPEELEAATGLTVMGVIPSVRAAKPRALLAYMIEKPNSGLAEAVRNLRTAIQLSDMDMAPKSIMVSSSVPGEGKTSTAIALAQSWASSGKKVLLLDCDLRRGSLRTEFKIETKSGLIAVLSGNTPFEEAVSHHEGTGIDVLIADSSKVTGVDVFSSKSYEAFIAKMRDLYDYIIIDTPPMLAVPDARVIAQNTDAVVYLAHWDSTSRRMIRSGLDLLYQVNVHVKGLALTRMDSKRMHRYGYFGYGYQGGKIDKYYAN
jgi:capsular exopolysaccharide synthesis family protein